MMKVSSGSFYKGLLALACLVQLALFVAAHEHKATLGHNDTLKVEVPSGADVDISGVPHLHGHHHHHLHNGAPKAALKGPTVLSLKDKYIYSLCAILIISVTSLVGVALIPITRKYPGFSQHLMTFLVALSIGSLVGDATMHLIPESFVPHSHGASLESANCDHADHHSDGSHMRNFLISLFIVLGIYTFFLFEKLLQRFHHGHGHSHTHSSPIDQQKVRDGHIRPIGWLILFGEVLHNLSDGLAIGAAFSESFGSGMSTALAVLWHEVPHELGDYVVLINAGFTPFRALLFNFLANISAFLGCILAVAITSGTSNSETIKSCIMGFTAGSFLYVALADLVPELQHEHEANGDDTCPLQIAATMDDSEGMTSIDKKMIVEKDGRIMKRKETKRKNIRWFCQQGGMLSGFAILAVVAYYEDSLNQLIA